MRFIFTLLMFWCGLPAYSNEFHLCGQVVPEQSADLPLVQLAPAPKLPSAVYLSWRSLNPASLGQLRHCGGALIAPRWVVTARHCVGDKNWSEMRVFVPETGQSLTAASSLCPNETAVFPKDDIALLKLTEPAAPVSEFAVVSEKPQKPPYTGELFSWQIRGSRPAKEPTETEIAVFDQTQVPLLRGQKAKKTGRVPCGGESGSVMIDGNGHVMAVLTAISASRSGRPNCNDPETGIFLTPLPVWAPWIQSTIDACATQPNRCISRE